MIVAILLYLSIDVKHAVIILTLGLKVEISTNLNLTDCILRRLSSITRNTYYTDQQYIKTERLDCKIFRTNV